MAQLNQVFLIGNAVRDPELRWTPSGVAVCTCSIAVNRRWKTDAGESKEEVAFVECELWRQTAETFAKYVSKGHPVFIQGRISWQSWLADGATRTKLFVTVEHFQFLRSAPETNGGESTAEPEKKAVAPTAKSKVAR